MKSIELETTLAELLKELKKYLKEENDYKNTNALEYLFERYEKEVIVYSSQLEHTHYRRDI